MNKLKMISLLYLSVVLFVGCNSTENKAMDEAINLMTSTKSTFTCKIDGKEFVSTAENANMVLDMGEKAIIVGGDDGKYSITINIPYDSPTDKPLQNFTGFYTDHAVKIRFETYDTAEKKLVITKRSKGFIAGTFSFKVDRGAENLKPFEITDGNFETTLLLDQ